MARELTAGIALLPFKRVPKIKFSVIAGVIVSQPVSKLGVAGVAPSAKVIAYRGCWESVDSDTHCNTLSLARALDAVTRSDVDILNLSLSGPKDLLLDSLIERIVAQKTMVVAAFDPNRVDEDTRFPSKNDGVLLVRANILDRQYGNVFSAPGERLVASPGNRYDHMVGHSVAAAYTSGVLALYKQAGDSGVIETGQQGWEGFPRAANSDDILRYLLKHSSSSGVSEVAQTRFAGQLSR